MANRADAQLRQPFLENKVVDNCRDGQEPFGSNYQELAEVQRTSRVQQNCYKPFILRPLPLAGIIALNLVFAALGIISLHAQSGPRDGTGGVDPTCYKVFYVVTGVPKNNGTSNSTQSVQLGEILDSCPPFYTCKKEDLACSGAPSPPLWTNFVHITKGQYFIGTYLATTVAMSYRMIWLFLRRNLLLVIPYHKMGRPKGAAASKSVCFEPSAITINLVTIIGCLTALSMPIASESITFKTSGQCTATTGGDSCKPSLYFNKLFAGILVGIAFLNSLLLVALTLSLRTLSTGVLKDPSSIAAVASLMEHPTVSNILKSFQKDTQTKTVKERLNGSNWKLSNWNNPNGFGFVVNTGQNILETHIEDITIDTKSPSKEDEKLQRVHPRVSPALKKRRIIPSWTRMTHAVLFFIYLAAILIVITYYRWTSNMDSGFEHFMDSQSTGLRFLWTTIALVVSYSWRVIEYEARLEEPFQRLIKGPTPAKDSIFINTNTIPLTAFGISLCRGHYYLACMSLNALLAEIVTVTLPAVPYSSSTSYRGFTTSVYLSQAVLIIMLLSLLWHVFRPYSALPRSPKSIAIVMTYLQGSWLIKGLRGMLLTNDPIDSEWMKVMCSMQFKTDTSGISRMVIDVDQNDLHSLESRLSLVTQS